MTETELGERRSTVVTGASSGIGLAVAKRLLADGHTVVGLSRTAGPLAGARRFQHWPLDLENLEDLPGALESLLRDVPSCSHLVLAAGRGTFGGLEQHSYGQIASLFAINAIAPAFLCRAYLPSMKRLRGGHIVFIGSESALRARRDGSVYCSTKFAVRGLARALRDECARSGVRVTVIHPGPVDTPFFDELDFVPGDESDQHLTADDVADAVLMAMRQRTGAVVDEIELSPLKRVFHKRSREKPT